MSIFDQFEKSHIAGQGENFSNEFKIGAFFQHGNRGYTEEEMAKKVLIWRQMAEKARQTSQLRSQTTNSSGQSTYEGVGSSEMALGKIDKMIATCSLTRKSSFIRNFLDGKFV